MDNDEEEYEDARFEYECQACDIRAPLDDLGLCDECGPKFERDMIRKRAWDYSVTAFGVPEEEREALRAHVIRHHGERLELLAPDDSPRPDPPSGIH